MSKFERTKLVKNIIAGLTGGMTVSYGLPEFRSMLEAYKGIGEARFRENLFSFLAKILPSAEVSGVKLAIHPDDPPRSMFGLPRIIFTAEDLNCLFDRLPSASNGITLCVGTYGSRPDNDLPMMAKQFGSRIHFSHLRGVTRDQNDQRSFVEVNHLDSDIDMVAVIKALLKEESSRSEGNSEIFICPDHEHQMMDDLNKEINPGY